MAEWVRQAGGARAGVAPLGFQQLGPERKRERLDRWLADGECGG
jgi:hypothetical protein